MPDIYEALVSFAKVNKEFADELDPDQLYWERPTESTSYDQPSSIEEEFLGWINDSVSPYSFLIEYFYGDCENDNVKLRKDLLYKWMLAAFTEGWKRRNAPKY